MIQTKIGPALLEALREGEGWVEEGSLISLGKLHPIYKPEGTTILEVLQSYVNDSKQRVADAALFSMGLMGDFSSARALIAIAGDDELGRELLECERVSTRKRSIAAFALGQLSVAANNNDVRRYVVHGLSRILREDDQASSDLHVACVTSIGLAGLPSEVDPLQPVKRRGKNATTSMRNLEAQIRFLGEVLADSKREDLVRAHVPRSMAMLTRGADPRHQDLTLEILLDALDSGRRMPRLVRYGLVEAVGVLADSDKDAIDKHARKSLHHVVSKGQPIDRGLALVALGLSSSRAGEDLDDPLASFGTERNFLMKYFVNGKSNTRQWAALAIGLQGYHVHAHGGDLSASTGRAVEAIFGRTKSPISAGAHAIALGLRGDIDCVPRLIERLEDSRDETVRAQIAIALGLIGERSAVLALEQVMESSDHLPMLLRDSAIALALLGQKEVVIDLVEVIAAGESLPVLEGAVAALSLVGDARAVDPLVRLLNDSEQQALTRGHAAMALGVICETSDLSWKASFSNHLNYHAMVPTLNNEDGTGVLSIR